MAQYQQSQIPIQPNMTYQSPAYMGDKSSELNTTPAPAYQSGHNHIHQHQATGKGSSSKWSFGLFDCFSPLPTCCLSFWCPCYLFGKTYERRRSGEKDPSGFNAMCAAFCFMGCCGVASCLQCFNRSSMREKYDIEGNMGVDFMASMCCACCTLVQEEKESIVRETGLDPKTGVVYQAVERMDYA